MDSKKTVLVTGASGGIGSAIAESFLADGHRVALHANRHYDAVLRAQNDAKARSLSAFAVRGDLENEGDIESVAAAVRAEYGHIDVLVNNAGIALPQQLITDCTAEDWDRLFAIDVRAVFLMTKAVLPDMIQRRSGSIVNIASIWGVAGGSCEAPYTAAKAAVIGLTKALSREAGPSNVRVNCVAPGFADTGMNAHLSGEDAAAFFQDTPLLRAADPKEIAKAVKFLALSDASFITGQVLAVDGGYTV